MAVLTTQRTTVAGGAVVTYSACSVGGDSYANSGREVLHLHNTDSGSHTATITCQTPCNLGGTTVHNYPVAVAAGTFRESGPFSTSFFSDGTGSVQITYDAVTGMTAAVVGPY